MRNAYPHLIWALAAVVIALAALRYFGKPLLRLINEKVKAYARTDEERRFNLDVRRGSLAAEIAAAVAKLRAETAGHEAEAEAIRLTIDEAVDGHRRALAARAEAEEDLAEEIVRTEHEAKLDDGFYEAYMAYCNACVQVGSKPDHIDTWSQTLQR